MQNDATLHCKSKQLVCPGRARKDCEAYLPPRGYVRLAAHARLEAELDVSVAFAGLLTGTVMKGERYNDLCGPGR